VFSTEELGKITEPYENRIVASSELEDLRVALTRYYIDHGYINHGAGINVTMVDVNHGAL